MHQPVQLPIALKRPRMYIGEGSCFELHYLIVGYLLNEAQRDGDANGRLFAGYYKLLAREIGSGEASVQEAELRARRSDDDLAWLIGLVAGHIERHNASASA